MNTNDDGVRPEILRAAMSPTYRGENDGSCIALTNLRGGKIHADTVDVSVYDGVHRRGHHAHTVTLTPQTAITVALELLQRAAASPRLESHEIAELAERLDGK